MGGVCFLVRLYYFYSPSQSAAKVWLGMAITTITAFIYRRSFFNAFHFHEI